MSEIKFDKGTLIGRGKTSRVYKIEDKGHHFVRKEFCPIHHVRLWNWFFYHSPHPSLRTPAIDIPTGRERLHIDSVSA